VKFTPDEERKLHSAVLRAPFSIFIPYAIIFLFSPGVFGLGGGFGAVKYIFLIYLYAVVLTVIYVQPVYLLIVKILGRQHRDSLLLFVFLANLTPFLLYFFIVGAEEVQAYIIVMILIASTVIALSFWNLTKPSLTDPNADNPWENE
jgi:hypothetical protein